MFIREAGVGSPNSFPVTSGLQARIRDAMYNGTSSYAGINNAFGYSDGSYHNSSLVSSSLSDAKSALRSYTNGVLGSPASSGSSGPSGSSGSSGSRKKLDYYEAPISEKYGFGKETAYQEALANTAYRREMADMRKAGLNPSIIYGSHNSSGAGSNIFPRSSGSSGSSGFSGGSSRGNSGKIALSGGLYYGTMAAVGAITSIVTKNTGAGMMAASIAGTALKALNGFLSK